MSTRIPDFSQLAWQPAAGRGSAEAWRRAFEAETGKAPEAGRLGDG